MWRVALGIVVFVRAGLTFAQGEPQDEGAVRADCAAESADKDCTADETVVPEAPPVAPAAPAAVAPAAPVAAGPVGPGRTAFATVSFRNDVGKKLRLVQAQFTMDGEALPTVLTSAEPGKSYVILSGALTPGPHVVSARLTYRGDRAVFSYMKGYKLNVRSDQVLTAPAERPVAFTVVGREINGLTQPLEKRVVISVEDGARRK